MSAPGDGLRETILVALAWAADRGEPRLTFGEIRRRVRVPVPDRLVSAALEDLVRSGYADRSLGSASGPGFGISPAGHAFVGERYESVPLGDKTGFKVKAPDLALPAPGAKLLQAVQDYSGTRRIWALALAAVFAVLLLLIGLAR